jgi:hypothetical protein
LVFTRSKNEYREMRAIAASTREENKRPPLKKLTMVSAQRRRILLTARLTPFPETKPQSQRTISEAKKKLGGKLNMCRGQASITYH